MYYVIMIMDTFHNLHIVSFFQEIIGLKNLLMIVGGKEVCLVFQA